MANETEVFGVANAIARFKTYGIPSHAVFQGSDMIYKFVTDDQDEALTIFSQNISSIDPESMGRYSCKFYEFDDAEKGKITSKTESSGMFRFKVSERGGGFVPATNSNNSGGGGKGYLSYGDQMWMNFQNQRIAQLESEKEDLLAELEDYRDQELNKDNKLGVIGLVGEAGNQYPWLQDSMNKLIDMAHGLMQKVNPGAVAKTETATSAKVNVDPKTEEENSAAFQAAVKKMHAFYVDQYKEKGDSQFASDMAKLANLTDKPMIFNAAISQLRSM